MMFSGAIPQHPVKTTDKPFALLELRAPIQAAVIPLALSGRDIIGLARTGSGETAAFALPHRRSPKLVGKQPLLDFHVSKLADVFDVSEQAMTIRLSALRLL